MRLSRLSPVAARLVLIAFGGLAAAVALAVLELGAALFLAIAPPAATADAERDTVSTSLAHLDINPSPMIPDADLMWRNAPGARKTQSINPLPFGSDATWTIENDAESFRGPERVPPVDRSRVYRIVCVGDSVTFGFNVDQPDTYPNQLLQLLRARHPGRDFEVINAGVPGWSWLQGLRFLQTRGLAMDPDLVVIGHGTNDQFQSARMTDEERMPVLGATSRPGLRDIARALTSSALYRLFFPVGVAPSDETISPACREQIRRDGVCRRVSLPQIAQAVERIARLVSASGRDLVVANTDFIGTAAAEGARDGARHAGIPLLDLVADFQRLRQADEDARAQRLGLSRTTIAPTTETSGPTRIVLLRMLVPDPALPYRAEAQPLLDPRTTLFRETARDDGQGGDERAGDRVYTARFELPSDVHHIEYRYFTGSAPEFQPLPPMESTLGKRALYLPSGGYGPVDVFGQTLLMTERTHPDRAGHARVAELIANEVAARPSFRRFVADRRDAAR